MVEQSLELKRIVKELENEVFKMDLKINLKKTVLISNQHTQSEIILSNNKILVENITIYLGQENRFEKKT